MQNPWKILFKARQFSQKRIMSENCGWNIKQNEKVAAEFLHFFMSHLRDSDENPRQLSQLNFSDSFDFPHVMLRLFVNDVVASFLPFLWNISTNR